MKKPKFIFKIDNNTRGKVYLNHKWHKDVTCIDIHGVPNNYIIELEKYKRNSANRFCIENNEIVTYKTTYRIKRNGL